MSDISTKITYLNTTKGKIKDVINMTGANITSDTTFRNYATKLYDGYVSFLKDKNTLLDNMPKGTSAGTITDAVDLPVYEDKMSKESTQDGTPTPENPVEVKTVKGYRNLFDKDNALIGYEMNGSNGTVSLNNSYYTSDFIPVKANENYYLQKEINIEGASNCFYDINHNFISRVRKNDGVITIPDNNNIAYMRFNGSIIQENVQLTKGTEKLPYVPYGTNYVAITNTNGTDTNYYTIPLNDNEIAGIGDYKDELIVDKNGKCWLNKKIAKIDSYNGETITINYMSTTGGLDTGATVYYVLDTPTLIDLNYTVDIELFKGINNISNSDDMDMEIKYIKDTYE